MVREWEAEADRMGKENNDLCDKIFELRQECLWCEAERERCNGLPRRSTQK